LPESITVWPELMFSLSSAQEEKGWGEEADFIEQPSPRSFLAGRERNFLVVVRPG
jgi:hypothetical protein